MSTTPITDEVARIAASAGHIKTALQLIAAKLEPPPPPPPPARWAKGGYGLDQPGAALPGKPTDPKLPDPLAQYDLVISADWQVARLTQLGSAGMLYTSGVSCRPAGTGWYGVTAEELHANGWQLKSAAGDDVPNRSFPKAIMADVGNVAYQERWATNVAAYCADHGLTRIFLDDVDTNLSHYAAASVPAYPNGAGWKDAHTRFVRFVATFLAGSRISVYPNVADGVTTATFALSLKPATGAMLEDFGTVYGAPVAKQILDGGMDVIALAYAPVVGKEALLRGVDNGRAVYMVTP